MEELDSIAFPQILATCLSHIGEEGYSWNFMQLKCVHKLKFKKSAILFIFFQEKHRANVLDF